MPHIPHWAVPFRVENGRVVTVEEDSSEEITQIVHIILNSLKGERLSVPDFGLEDPTFRTMGGTLQADITAEVERWEPRAELSFDEFTIDETGSLAGRVYVAVRGGE